MLVLAAVPERLQARLRKAAGLTFEMTPASTWDEALHAILRRPVEIAVVEPSFGGVSPRAGEIERLRILFPSLPTILYTYLSPGVAPVLLRLGRCGIREVLLAGHDDHPGRVREALTAEGSRALTTRLAKAIIDLLSDCPGELRWAIETMLHDPVAVQSVQELAERARVDRRTLLRWFQRNAMPPPKVMLTVIKATYAHRLLQDPGYTVEDVAERLGYSQTRTLAMAIREVFGMTPGELRVRLTPEEALDAVRQRFFTQSDAVLGKVS